MDNNNKILVSCIVPIYKVPNNYLERCVKSLINQTLKNIEIILVDDGSPDNCGTICDEFAKEDKRIKVIHQENKGLAGARNSGLEISNGNYITYVDGDDYLDENGIERLYSYTKDKNYDVIRGQYYRDKEEKIGFKNIQINKIYNGKDDMIFLKENVLNLDSRIYMAWGALYKIDLLKDNGIYNDEKLKQGSEDTEFNFRLFDYAKTAIFVNEYCYHYTYNENSISAYTTEENNYRVLDCFSKILENIKKQDAKYYEQLYLQFNIRMLYVIVTTFISGYFNPKNTEKMSVKRKQISNYLKQDIVKDALKHKYIKKLDIKRKIVIMLIRLKWFEIISFLGNIRMNKKIRKMKKS